MKNPFEYGSIVVADSFCNRHQEIADIQRAIDNEQRLFITAERRVGKTSLLKHVLARLSDKEYMTVYIDLWPTDSQASFIAAFAASLTEAASTTPQKMLEFARSFFGKLVPTISLDDQGKPQASFGVVRDRGLELTLAEALAAPGRIAQRTGKRVVIVVDEFQQLLEYENDMVERQLRTSIQEQKGVSYIFSGSRKHLIQKMVLDKSRPLHRAGPHYPLGPIDPRHWLEFIGEKFRQSQKQVDDEQVLAVCGLTQGHPYYTQHLCHELWELVESGQKVTDLMIEQSLEIVLTREDYAYSTLWDSLAVNQRRLLEGLAREDNVSEIFASEFIDLYELKSPSNVQRAVKALLSRDIIDREGKVYFVIDRFFKLWIRRKHA